MSVSISSLTKEIEFFKIGMNDYLNKFMASEERITELTTENEILKQVIERFQQEYKLLPIDFTKISELVIEDLADSSKRSQKKIVNSILPKFRKNEIIQTDQMLIIRTSNITTQTKIEVADNYTENDISYIDSFTQTSENRRRRFLDVYKQSSFLLYPKYKSKKFVMVNSRMKNAKVKIRNENVNSQESSLVYNNAGHYNEGYRNEGYQNIGYKNIGYNNTEHYHKEHHQVNNEHYLGIPSTSRVEEMKNTTKNDTFESFANDIESRVLSVCSCKSSSADSFEITIQNSPENKNNPENTKPEEIFSKYRVFNRYKSYTPSPKRQRKLLHHRKEIFQRFISPAEEVLIDCLKISSKKLASEATLSARTLLKTISSMYLSSAYKIKKYRMPSFLEHVFSKLSSRYSLKRMREKRLKDLIASSIMHKELQGAKLFLRMLGAGKCIGLSNYSLHTFKILLQILNILDNSSVGITIAEINGKKMCPRTRAYECAREIFHKKFDTNEFNKLLAQIEYHSKCDSYGINKEGIVDYEWLVNYMIYTFDYYEKQVIAGTRKIVDAVSLNPFAICMTKAEFIIGIRSIHPDYLKYIEDKNL